MTMQIFTGTNTKDGKQIHGEPLNLKLVEYPAESLLLPSIAVDPLDPKVQHLCEELCYYYSFLRKRVGRSIIGIAAPQVGHNVRIFIVFDTLYINPEILWTPKFGHREEIEGCLSLPVDQSWSVRRPYGVNIKWQDLNGNWNEKRYNDINARAIQHEMDHLNGKLCCGENYPK